METSVGAEDSRLAQWELGGQAIDIGPWPLPRGRRQGKLRSALAVPGTLDGCKPGFQSRQLASVRTVGAHSRVFNFAEHFKAGLGFCQF
jgi:hypothetical protein